MSFKLITGKFTIGSETVRVQYVKRGGAYRILLVDGEKPTRKEIDYFWNLLNEQDANEKFVRQQYKYEMQSDEQRGN